MRQAYSQQLRLDCQAVPNVKLNLNCRHELIPVLRALQHVYQHAELRDQVLALVAQDVNRDSVDDRGRKGLDYWTILVLAAVRLGCGLDYDQLQDLAENHRVLRQIMGIGDWDEATSFHWSRLRSNVSRSCSFCDRNWRCLILAVRLSLGDGQETSQGGLATHVRQRRASH